jgi:hypothetical protein
VSIVAMMQDAAGARTAAPRRPRPLRRHQAESGTASAPPAAAVAAVAAELVRFIPTEAVAAYTAILPLLVAQDTALADQDYTARWALAGAVLALAVLFAVGTYRAELRAQQPPRQFRWPPKRTLLVALAFSAWVFTIPGSPFGDFTWYEPAIGFIGGVGTNAALVLFQLWFGGPEQTGG